MLPSRIVPSSTHLFFPAGVSFVGSTYAPTEKIQILPSKPRSVSCRNVLLVKSECHILGGHSRRATVRCSMDEERTLFESSPKTIASAIQYGHVQHVAVLVEDTAAAKRFYMEVLGMADDHALRNPKLPFDGTFLKAGNSQIHLMELPSVDPKTGRPEHGGR
jgi:hypothetical protein